MATKTKQINYAGIRFVIVINTTFFFYDVYERFTNYDSFERGGRRLFFVKHTHSRIRTFTCEMPYPRAIIYLLFSLLHNCIFLFSFFFCFQNAISSPRLNHFRFVTQPMKQCAAQFCAKIAYKTPTVVIVVVIVHREARCVRWEMFAQP